MFIIVVILSNVLMQSLSNSVLDKDGGLYKPDINHFLLSILSSFEIDSTFWNSKFNFLSQARSGLAYATKPPPYSVLSACHKWKSFTLNCVCTLTYLKNFSEYSPTTTELNVNIFHKPIIQHTVA